MASGSPLQAHSPPVARGGIEDRRPACLHLLTWPPTARIRNGLEVRSRRPEARRRSTKTSQHREHEKGNETSSDSPSQAFTPRRISAPAPRLARFSASGYQLSTINYQLPHVAPKPWRRRRLVAPKPSRRRIRVPRSTFIRVPRNSLSLNAARARSCKIVYGGGPLPLYRVPGSALRVYTHHHIRMR